MVEKIHTSGPPTMITRFKAIGTAGGLHGADGCGVHFEARFKSFESVPFLEYWNAPLGVGDWRQDSDFLSFYPETRRLLTRLAAVENGDLVDQPLLLHRARGTASHFS